MYHRQLGASVELVNLRTSDDVSDLLEDVEGKKNIDLSLAEFLEKRNSPFPLKS